ncbi:MAG: MotA/TolQ/ExbB proton channel family protein [Sedimentisphaerales bacterium]|nr:MotA/TolQ/ExbB proton channel family protein [Sedimentisphaerales bacterium]
MTMTMITGQLTDLWRQAIGIWISGGWGMIALAANALVLFVLGLHVYLRLSEKGYQYLPEGTWRNWIDHPKERRGPVGELLDFVTGANSLKQAGVFFEELRTTEIVPFERDLRVMRVCVSTAPLLGLLGTVTGMLATFGALASGAGGEKTMGLVAKGISEALVTTETGLVIALPGLFLQYQLSRRLERYKAFLAQLETICTQNLYKTLPHHDKAVSKHDRTPHKHEKTARRHDETIRTKRIVYQRGRVPLEQEVAA